MSADPHMIPRERIIELLVGLGLDPDMTTLASVTIDPFGVTVVRNRVDENGRMYVVGEEMATETVLIRIGTEAQWRGSVVAPST